MRLPDKKAAAEMKEREAVARRYLEAKGLHLVERPMPPMPRIILGRSPASPYAVMRAQWLGVVWVMETRCITSSIPKRRHSMRGAISPGFSSNEAIK